MTECRQLGEGKSIFSGRDSMNKGTENRDTEAREPVWEGGRNLAGTKLWEGKSEQHGLMGCLLKQKNWARWVLETAKYRSVQICKVFSCKNHPWLVNRLCGLEGKWFFEECFMKDSPGGVLKLRAKRKSKKESDDRRGLWQKWTQKFLRRHFHYHPAHSICLTATKFCIIKRILESPGTKPDLVVTDSYTWFSMN